MIERIIPNEIKYSSVPCSIVAVGTAYEILSIIVQVSILIVAILTYSITKKDYPSAKSK